MYEDGTFHAEHVNDRWKLMMHRIIARKLSQDPEAVIAEGRAWLTRMRREDRWIDPHDYWDRLLRKPPNIIRREITRRTEHMYWMRLSSPLRFDGINDVEFRRRSYRLAVKGLKLRSQRLWERNRQRDELGPTNSDNQ